MTGKGPESGPERGSAKGTQKKNRKGETDEQMVRTRVRKRDIQLNHALTDFRGPMIFFCNRRTSVIVNKVNKRNELEGMINLHPLLAEFRWWRVRLSGV